MRYFVPVERLVKLEASVQEIESAKDGPSMRELASVAGKRDLNGVSSASSEVVDT